MRVTTWLLKECIGVEALAFVIESYLMGSDPYLLYSRTRPKTELDGQENLWINVGCGGHAELIVDRVLCHFDDCRDVVIGVCMSGDIEMIKVIHTLGVNDFNAGFEAFINTYKKDTTSHNLRAAELLLDLGGFMVIHDGQIVHAAKQGDVDMCRFLIDKGFPSLLAWSHAGYRCDDNLLELVINRNRRPDQFFHTICAACEYGRLVFIKHIAEKYSDVISMLKVSSLLKIAITCAITGDIYNEAEYDNFNVFTNDHADVIEYLLMIYPDINANDLLSNACNQGASKSFAVLSNAGFKNCYCGLDIASHTSEYLNTHRLRNLKYVTSVWEER